MPDGLEIVTDDGVRTLVLDRPDAGNALDLGLARALRDAVAAAEDDAGIRVLVLRARGKLFCAGGDVRAMAEAAAPPRYVDELAGALHELVLALADSRLVSIAVVHGAAAGAGLGIALNADLVLAGPRARFLSAYGALGVSPDCGVSYLLPRVVGRARASLLALTDLALDARGAVEWGLAAESFESEEALEQRLGGLVELLVAASPAASAATRHLLRRPESDYAAHLDAERASIAALAAGDDGAARIRRFAGRG